MQALRGAARYSENQQHSRVWPSRVPRPAPHLFPDTVVGAGAKTVEVPIPEGSDADGAAVRLRLGVLMVD